jgi:nicotinate phosphoribosyltransferase
MQQVFLSKFPSATATYKFKCRNKNINLSSLKDEIQHEIYHLTTLKYRPEELSYLKSCDDLFQRSFIYYLSRTQLNCDYVDIQIKNDNLEITITGPLVEISPFEIYILKIVHEVYSRNVNKNLDLSEGKIRLLDKIAKIKAYQMKTGRKLNIIDFGTRRTFSSEWHEYVLRELISRNILSGTSNVYYAMKYNLKPIGTFAHEFVQTFQAIVNPIDSQKAAFQCWQDFYRGKLGIALTDTLGNKKFFNDFDFYFAKLYDGVRHDSGCPFIFGDMMINHYIQLGVDPTQKTIIFSDSLTIDKAIELDQYFKDRIKLVFGIGTHLTNDLGVDALQNVIKQVSVNGLPTAKLSNDAGKTMSDDVNYCQYLKTICNKEII